MSQWNYRVFKDEYGALTFRETVYEGLEVSGWTSWAAPRGETLDELRSDLCGMLLALGKPIIDEKKEQKKADRKIAKAKEKSEGLKKSKKRSKG